MYTLADNSRQQQRFHLQRGVGWETPSSSLGNAKQQGHAIAIKAFASGTEQISSSLNTAFGQGRSMVGLDFEKFEVDERLRRLAKHVSTPRLQIPSEERTGPTFELARAKYFLSHGQVENARRVLESALLAYPSDQGVLKLHQAVSPGRVERKNVQYIDRRSEVAWITANRPKYKGKWVALLGSKPIAIADDLKALLRAVAEQRPEEIPLIHHLD